MTNIRDLILWGVVFSIVIQVAPIWSAATGADWTTDVKLSWDATTGVTVQTPAATVLWDRNAIGAGPALRLRDAKHDLRLSSPTIERPSDWELVLRYEAAGPNENGIQITRRLKVSARHSEVDLVEEFALTPAKTIVTDLEIMRFFSAHPATAMQGKNAGSHHHLPRFTGPVHSVLPLYSGWARTFPPAADHLVAEWQLGNVAGDRSSQQLGLPVLQFHENERWLGAVCADSDFGSTYIVDSSPRELSCEVTFSYAASKVPLAAQKTETRRFGLWLAEAKTHEPFGRSIDAFYRLMLPDVPPGPKWLHEIAMVGYDFLSDNGQGWEKDVNELARLLKPEERRRVALCFHGWYDALGGYSYDDAKKEIKPEWVAMGRTRKVRLTPDEMRRRLKLARDVGFRVLLYFGDGLLQDSGTPAYRPQWDMVNLEGNKRGGWTGPDTWGDTFTRNPAHPEVFQWYQDYLAALLRAFGPQLDGFVWDETFYVRAGTITLKPEPAYCDRAMMRLVRTLAAQVHAADPQKVFLASDCIHSDGLAPKQDMIPGYAMMADGAYQDTGCAPTAWSYGLFPTWRNTLWSCNWDSVSHLDWTRFGVEHYGAPVAISNGWSDDRGPSEWTAAQREQILQLFRWRLGHNRVRYLTGDPQKSIPTAPVAR